MSFRTLISITLVLYSHALFGLTETDLVRQGTLLRLAGDFVAANAIEQRLINEFETPVGHVFALNSIITHLTWDETQTQYDDELLQHTGAILTWCEPRTSNSVTAGTANYYCGLANFALAFLRGLRGSYYKSGRHGTLCIEYLEKALREDPSLTDAKMYLGVAYHTADNLPPFIRMFSRFLWFIPTGNSQKSLPYLREVVEGGDQYRDVARYVYSVLLLSEPDAMEEARHQLETLVELYPNNSRFQLRLISTLLLQENYAATLAAAEAYLALDVPPVEPDRSLARIWMIRAYIGLGRIEAAQQLFNNIEPVISTSRNSLPGWSIAWHILTSGQLHDLANRREQATGAYHEIIAISESGYVNEIIENAARAGLLTPYTLP